jgi:hypothetical protein
MVNDTLLTGTLFGVREVMAGGAKLVTLLNGSVPAALPHPNENNVIAKRVESRTGKERITTSCELQRIPRAGKPGRPSLALRENRVKMKDFAGLKRSEKPHQAALFRLMSVTAMLRQQRP